MNKIRQNKITFTLILSIIILLFSSLTILCLPVLFNYKSKAEQIEKNYYKNFKIYLNSLGDISYKPFPKPHLVVENALLNLPNSQKKNEFTKTSNLKIFISLRSIYLRSMKYFNSTEISDSNLEFKTSDLIQLRKHLYEKINKPIVLSNCKIFIKNKQKEVVLITPVKKLTNKINTKTKIKNLNINGEIFGLKFKSNWKRNYNNPSESSHNINLFNPNIEIKNKLKIENNMKFNINSLINFGQDKLEYFTEYNNDKISISSPNNKNTNFNLYSNIQLNPFYFNGKLIIKNKNVQQIIDNIFSNLILYNEKYLGNFNGMIEIQFDQLDNKLIKKGKLDVMINEKKIVLKNAEFNLYKIGNIKTSFNFIHNKGDIKFISKNLLKIDNHIEFAKIFQISSKKVKKIKQIYFDLEKNIGDKDFVITNVKINNLENEEKSAELFNVKNIQNLRSHIRKVIN